jgi:hypothetical protein
VAKPRKPPGPPKRGGKIDYPDMFEWAKAIPATLELVVGDVSTASEKAVPTIFLAFLAVWLPMPDDYALKNTLGFATLVTFLLAAVVWVVRSRRSKMLPSRVVAWHSGAVIGVSLITGLVIVSGLYQGWVHSSAKQQEADKQHQENEAVQAAAAEVKKQAQIAQDAAARAAAAKDEAARASESAKAKIAEANCLQARDDAVQQATKAQSSARKAVDDCKTQFDETLITLKTVRQFCEPAYGRLDSARAQLADATSKSCGTDATGSIERAK